MLLNLIWFYIFPAHNVFSRIFWRPRMLAATRNECFFLRWTQRVSVVGLFFFSAKFNHLVHVSPYQSHIHYGDYCYCVGIQLKIFNHMAPIKSSHDVINARWKDLRIGMWEVTSPNWHEQRSQNFIPNGTHSWLHICTISSFSSPGRGHSPAHLLCCLSLLTRLCYHPIAPKRRMKVTCDLRSEVLRANEIIRE